MKIKLHGGECCGIKCIHSLGSYPPEKLVARKAIKMTSFGRTFNSGTNDMRSWNNRGQHDFFCEAAPKETHEERFNRFVTYIKEKRKHGIIEVVLNACQPKWIPILEALNFKAVTSGTNSNSGSTITIYHLVY